MSETVRVRIAVAMDFDGDWSASGESASSDVEMADSAEANLEDTFNWMPPRHVVFVEADVPKPVKPEPLTVEGEVSEGESAGGEP